MSLTSVFVILACYAGWIIVKRLARRVIAIRKRRREAALPKPEPKKVSRSGRPIHRLQDYRTPVPVEDEYPPRPEPRVHLELGSYYVIGQSNSYGYAIGAIVLVTEREILALDEGRPALARTPEVDAEFWDNVVHGNIRFAASAEHLGAAFTEMGTSMRQASGAMAQSLQDAFRGFDRSLGQLGRAVQHNDRTYNRLLSEAYNAPPNADLRSLWSATTTTTTRGTRTGRAPANPDTPPARPVKVEGYYEATVPFKFRWKDDYTYLAGSVIDQEDIDRLGIEALSENMQRGAIVFKQGKPSPRRSRYDRLREDDEL
jgi:hypothetical protein